MANNDLDIDYDETRGGRRTADNLISFPSDGAFYLATCGSDLPWAPAGAHDPSRHVLPSILVEGIFASAPVPDPQSLQTDTVMTKCLDVLSYLTPALEKLIEEGLLKTLDEDGDEVDATFTWYEALRAVAPQIIAESPDDPAFQVTADKLEWLEGVDQATEEGKAIAWFTPLTFEDATRTTRDLSHVIALKRILGPHATHAERTRVGSTCYTMLGGGDGGQLAQAIKTFYYPSMQSTQRMDANFLAARILDFLAETQWPAPYRWSSGDTLDDAFDLPRRAAWATASRQEQASIIASKLGHALFDGSQLPTLAVLFADYKGDTPRLVREVQRVGDMMLYGDEGVKLPFWKIEEVETTLTRDYGEFIRSERGEGRNTTEILERLTHRANADRTNNETGRGGGGGREGETDVQGPKPGQMSRALAEASHVRLEGKYLKVLEDGSATLSTKLTLIKECVVADTVLAKAVLFASKGQRMTPYIGASDFLALLHGERHLLRIYVAQSLAYDDALGAVPEVLRTLMYDEEELRKTLDFEWELLDPLNMCILWLRGARVGTYFGKHSANNLYHDGDFINHVIDLYGKKFRCLGYPPTVPTDEGLSFEGFFKKIKAFQHYAVALSAEEQQGAYTMIDDLAHKAYKAAAAMAKRTIYGATPADRHLRAWISAEEPVVIELNKTLTALDEVSTHRRRMGSMLGNQPRAAKLPGFAETSGKGAAGTSSDGTATKKPQKSPKSPKGKAPAGPNATSAGASNKSSGGNQAKPTERKASPIYLYDDGSFSIGTPRPLASAPAFPEHPRRRMKEVGRDTAPPLSRHHTCRAQLCMRRQVGTPPHLSRDTTRVVRTCRLADGDLPQRRGQASPTRASTAGGHRPRAMRLLLFALTLLANGAGASLMLTPLAKCGGASDGECVGADRPRPLSHLANTAH